MLTCDAHPYSREPLCWKRYAKRRTPTWDVCAAKNCPNVARLPNLVGQATSRVMDPMSRPTCLLRQYIRFEGWYPDVKAKSLVLSSNCFRLARGFSSKFARCFFNQQGSTEASEILGFRRKPYIQRKCSRQSLHDPKYYCYTLELHGRVCAPVGLFNAQGQLCPNCFICVSEPFALHSIEI